jgi:hypothetical protein
VVELVLVAAAEVDFFEEEDAVVEVEAVVLGAKRSEDCQLIWIRGAYAVMVLRTPVSSG